MNRFLILSLTSGLLSPVAANADDFKVRDTCGRLARFEITGKEASKRLKLKKTLSNGEKIAVNDEANLYNFASYYWLFKGSKLIFMFSD